MGSQDEPLGAAVCASEENGVGNPIQYPDAACVPLPG